jgi:ribosomal protein S18 acetylase RimI-like enzyme
MKYEIRQMQTDEIPLIEGIDRSQELREEYHYTLIEDGLGLRLSRRLVSPTRHIPNWSKAELTSRFGLWTRNLEEGALMLGGYEGQNLAGFVLLTVHLETKTGEIYSLFVDRHHRGKGLGTGLLAKAESHCCDLKASNLILYTGHSAPAVDFYLKNNFRIVGIKDPRYAIKGFDLTLAKELMKDIGLCI